MGISDLPPKDGSVRPDEDFEMDWSVDSRAEKPIKAIVDALDGAENLFLATDPDREGEAISWHIEELLRERGLLDDITVKRVVFHEITKGAVQEAFNHPREVHGELVEAYLARRALDYLVGFKLSPVLWRKLPGSRSAGRVQSVALRLICEREAEIEIFRAQEYCRSRLASTAPKAMVLPPASSNAMARNLIVLTLLMKAPPTPPRVMWRPHLSGSPPSRKNGQSGTRNRHLRPQHCSRKLRASWGLAHPKPCGSPSGSMKGSRSMERLSA